MTYRAPAVTSDTEVVRFRVGSTALQKGGVGAFVTTWLLMAVSLYLGWRPGMLLALSIGFVVVSGIMVLQSVPLGSRLEVHQSCVALITLGQRTVIPMSEIQMASVHRVGRGSRRPLVYVRITTIRGNTIEIPMGSYRLFAKRAETIAELMNKRVGSRLPSAN